MRAFVRLRELIGTNRDLARRLDELEKRYGAQCRGVFDAIRQLMAPRERARRSIGFKVDEARPSTGSNGRTASRHASEERHKVINVATSPMIRQGPRRTDHASPRWSPRSKIARRWAWWRSICSGPAQEGMPR